MSSRLQRPRDACASERPKLRRCGVFVENKFRDNHSDSKRKVSRVSDLKQVDCGIQTGSCEWGYLRNYNRELGLWEHGSISHYHPFPKQRRQVVERCCHERVLRAQGRFLDDQRTLVVCFGLLEASLCRRMPGGVEEITHHDACYDRGSPS